MQLLMHFNTDTSLQYIQHVDTSREDVRLRAQAVSWSARQDGGLQQSRETASGTNQDCPVSPGIPGK